MSASGGTDLKSTISKPKSWVRIIDIEIPKDEVEKVYNKKLSEYKREITLPGFRQGKTPIAMVKNRFGASVFSAAVEEIIEQSFESACKEQAIVPISKGALSNLKAKEGEPVSFTIEIEIDPDVEIKGYTGLGISASPKKIKDGDVDTAIEEIRERSAEFKDVPRAAKKGDSVAIEYAKVVIDGAERKDFSNPKQPIELGSGDIKDFDKGLIGHGAGETVDVDVSFPKDFATKELAGKDAFFSVKILTVKEKVVPELTGEFLKKLGDFASEDALRDQVKKDLESKELDRAKNEAYAKAIERLADKNPFDIPESRIQSYIDHMIEELAKYARPGEQPPSREEVAQKYRDTAIRGIKRYKIIDYVATKEKIKPTQAEVDRQVQQLAAYYDQPFEQVKQTLRANGTTNRIRADIREQKTLDFLIGEYTPGVAEAETDAVGAEKKSAEPVGTAEGV
jgi:trigger factor